MEEEKIKKLRMMLIGNHPFLEQLTNDELYFLCDILNWVIKDTGDTDRGLELFAEALTDPDGEMIDIENIILWVKSIKEAVDMSDKDTVYPNALGFLLSAQQEYKRE